MSNGREIKKDKTTVVRKKITPVRKKRKTKDKIVNAPKPKMLGASGHLGLIVGGTGKIIKIAGNVIKKAVVKKLAKKVAKKKKKKRSNFA